MVIMPKLKKISLPLSYTVIPTFYHQYIEKSFPENNPFSFAFLTLSYIDFPICPKPVPSKIIALYPASIIDSVNSGS